MWYQTNLVRVRAKQFTGDVEEVHSWLEDNELSSDGFIFIPEEDRVEDPRIVAEVWDELHSSWVGVYLNDWIIIGTKGETYPCNDEVFQVKYSKYDKPDFNQLILLAQLAGANARRIEANLERAELVYDSVLEDLASVLGETTEYDEEYLFETAYNLATGKISIDDVEFIDE